MITEEQLELHRKYVYNEAGGIRLVAIGSNLSNSNLSGANLSNSNLRHADLSGANLSNSNLSNADLRYADLINAIGNQKEIHSLQLPRYKIVMTKDIINIGCKAYTKEEWLNFDKVRLGNMDGKEGLEWWDNYSKIVFELYDKIMEQIGEVV